MKHRLSRKTPADLSTFLVLLALFTCLYLLIPTATQSAPSPVAHRMAEDCNVAGNTLYLIDGASVGTPGDLTFAAGTAATSDTMPAASDGSHLIYRITNINGSYSSAATQFTLFLDAGTVVGNGIHAEIRYDFDGNGSNDRVERYNYFATNPLIDWETYTETSFGGLQTATGSYGDLVNGTVELHLWNAIGAGPSDVRTSATSSDGQQSRLTLPFNNMSIGNCTPPTPTHTPTPSLTPTVTPTASPTSDQPPTETPTPVACPNVANAAVALPGTGCYTTTLPAGEKSVTYWPAVDAGGYSAATPKVTGNYGGPLQTNDWWSSLIWDWNQGAASAPPREPHSQIMHPHPFSMQAEASGLRMSYAQELQAGTNVAGTGAVTGFANFLLPGSGAEHLKVTVAGMNAPDTRVDDYSDWTVTAVWDDGSNSLSATFGHGLPYVFFEKTGGAFIIDLVATPLNVVNSGEVFAFTASNNVGSRYGLFAPAGSTWTQNGLDITLNAPNGANYLAVAALPNDSASTLELFRQHAYNFVTDTRANYSVDATTQQVNASFEVITEAKESGGALSPLPLIALYRHQWLNLSSGPINTGLTYTTARGEMRLYETAFFTTQMQFGGVLPALPDLPIDGLDGYNDAQLQNYINSVYDPSGNYDYTTDPRETYWEGKNLNRLSQLVHLADQQGMGVQRDSFLTYLKTTLADWFDGEAPYVFYLDNNWNVLQGYPSGFGADSQINDHHFHWGYFMMAAATVAQYDPAWAAEYEGSVELLVRDAANWERTDLRFPYLRHFDPYSGHSWAAGHQAFGAGNNQESSSEAMNFAAAMILWGTAVNNTAMRDAGIYIYTTEQQAIEQYWFDVDEEVFPPQYAFDTVGILWGHGVAFATWWTANPEEIHGINFLPLTAGSLYLGQRADYVARNVADLYAAPGAEGHWHDLIWQYEALADPAAALARWASEPNYVANGAQEAGESTAHTYQWLHFFNAVGQVDTTVTADMATYAVFVNPATDERTCAAYNPTATTRTVTFSNGTSLDVAPRSLGATAVGDCVDAFTLGMATDGSFSWNPGRAVCNNQTLFRSPTPYSGHDPLLDDPATYDGSASLTSTVDNFFYYLQVNCGGELVESNEVGEFTFAIVAGG